MTQQAYYWTPKWQAGERASEEDFRRGDVMTFATTVEALRWLATEEPDNDKHDETVAPPEAEDPESPDNDPVEDKRTLIQRELEADAVLEQEMAREGAAASTGPEDWDKVEEPDDV